MTTRLEVPAQGPRRVQETGAVRLEERPYPLDRFIDELRRRAYPSECIDYYLRKQRAAA